METIKGFFNRTQAWDGVFMLHALSEASMSHCTRHQVGCVIVKDRRPIVAGINGASKGLQNCDEVFTEVPSPGEDGYEEYYEAHGRFSEENEQHAESNAISWAARFGLPIDGATSYQTLAPCLPCAKQMAASGIKRVVYLKDDDRDMRGVDFLKKAGIEVEKLHKEVVEEALNRTRIHLD